MQHSHWHVSAVGSCIWPVCSMDPCVDCSTEDELRGSPLINPGWLAGCSQINMPMASVEGRGGSDWWAANVGQDLSDRFPPPKQAAAAAQAPGEGQPHPRKQFEEHVLRQVPVLPTLRQRELGVPVVICPFFISIPCWPC